MPIDSIPSRQIVCDVVTIAMSTQGWTHHVAQLPLDLHDKNINNNPNVAFDKDLEHPYDLKIHAIICHLMRETYPDTAFRGKFPWRTTGNVPLPDKIILSPALDHFRGNLYSYTLCSLN